MPWLPELCSAPVLERVLEQRRLEQVRSVPYFAGLLSGELDALLGSFVDEPELFVPLRGRIKGEQAFRAFVAEMIVGELSLLSGQTVYLTAIATQPLRYIAVERDAFRRLLFEDGQLSSGGSAVRFRLGGQRRPRDRPVRLMHGPSQPGRVT
jgi:CRP-like cAMP-binding protein